MTKEELREKRNLAIENLNYAIAILGSDELYIDELEKENSELKEQNTNLQEMLKTERSVTCKEEYLKKVTELEQEKAELKAVERMALYSKMSDRLAKAEELLLELYDCIPSSMADSCKETLQKVALFFKDSEVEK